jgi:hypothetical protein
MAPNRVRWLVVVSAVVAGCSSAPAQMMMNNPGPTRPAGFSPPAAESGEIEFDSPIIPAIAPGTDVTYCSYLDTHVTDETDVVHYRVFESLTGHHAVLYAARQSRPVDTHVCTEDDMVNSRFLAGGGAEGVGTIEIPDGLAFRIPANTQLMMQTHWINATQNPVDGQAVAYITTMPSSPSRQMLDLFNVVKTDFSIPAGMKATASSTCTLKKDLQLFAIAGHAHEYASNVNIQLGDGTANNMLWNHDWQPQYSSAPPYLIYGKDQPLALKAGQQITVTCSWNNTSGIDLAFPREMCVSVGFYFPAVTGEIDCVDGNWGG